MKQFIIGAIKNLKLVELQPILINNTISVISDSTVYGEIINIPAFIGHIGKISFDKLMMAPSHMCIFNAEKFDSSRGHIDNLKVLNNYIGMMHSFQLALWLVKDNSVNIDETFFHDSKISETIRSTDTGKYSTANGNYGTMEFNQDEINEVFFWFDKIKTYTFLDNSSDYAIKEGENFRKQLPHQEFNRIGRALLYIVSARNDSFLPSKIANYMSAFEALISSGGEGLTSQVSERTAKFIGNDREEKLNIYASVRDAYMARSSYVHGDKQRSKIHKNIEDLSFETDKILRSLVKKIIIEFPDIIDLDSEKFTLWYRKNMLF